MGDCLRQVHSHGGRLAMQGVVGECHQAQLVLGVESVVDHDSAMCFGAARPHPARNGRPLTSQARKEPQHQQPLCAYELVVRDRE